MTTPTWAPGTLYQPGALVVPRSLAGQTQTPPEDPGFESGALTHWTATAVGGAGAGAVSATYAFEGSKSFFWAGGSGSQQEGGIGCNLVNNFRAPVVPGQSITASCYVMSVPLHREHGVFGSVRLFWYDAGNVLISTTNVAAYGDGGPGHGFGTTGSWVLSQVTGVAPPGAATASIGAFLLSNQGDANGSYADGFAWDYVAQALPDGLVFRAVQAASGYSGSSEPVWPIISGGTVVDNEVTWEAVHASRVVWVATPILVSGAVAPTFPTTPNGTVADGTIAWVAMDSRVKDPKCPHSKIVAIAASKVFAADGDIVAYCETVNPLGWSAEGDAGYLPFGLQTYGATPVAALGLYRSNLIAANSKGYQMWQVDEDPANMAILDASPMDCTDHRSMQPAANDLVMLTAEGIRNIGIAGASTNLQAGFFGKQVDPLVKELRALGFDPRGLFWPGTGQYWLFFGAQAIVLTMNGGPDDQSWSRYVFPYAVDDWTIHDSKLYLRAGTLVWEVNDEIEGTDDYYCDLAGVPVLSGARDGLANNLSWTAVADAVGYRLYANGAVLVDTTGATYVHSALLENTAYAYVVLAYDAAGSQSVNSNTVNLDVGGPLAPALSGAIGVDITTADLSWTAATTGGGPIVGYKLYNANTNALIGTFPSPATLSNTQTGLANDTTYSYYVTAYTAQSESAHSNTLVLDTGHPLIVVDVFTSNATWTKRALLISADVVVIGGGAGGAGGNGGPNLGYYGCTGGAGGGRAAFSILAGFLGATETVTVGAAGAGGTRVLATLGGAFGGGGAPGAASTFGAWATANGGTGGIPESGTGTIANNLGGIAFISGASGPTSKVTERGGFGINGGTPVGSTTYAGAGGGTGGGPGPPVAPGVCTNSGVLYYGGNGGAGGASAVDANASNGSAGVDYGSGGGAGGNAAVNVGPAGFSGVGAAGRPGVVVVINYLS